MKVVIAGAGFAGLQLARKLNNKKGIEVWLIDKVNYHQFQPLFYQVATGGLDASNISFPLRMVFQESKNVHIRLAEIKEIVSAENRVITDAGIFDYDVLVIATGADTNFFSNANIEKYSFPMKSTVEALRLRHRLVENFEKAVAEQNTPAFEKYMNIIVVGAGPTGVELSGALAEMRSHILPKDYAELDFSKLNIYLVEAGAKTLAAMSSASSADSIAYLNKLGVIIKTNTALQDYNGETAVLSSGEKIHAAMVIWAAGIKGNVPAGIDKNLIARGNRIMVDRFNKIKGHENIYAIGDIAFMQTPLYTNGHPQLANVAIGQAKTLAQNLIWQTNGNRHYQKEYEYSDKGSMATVGRHLAVVDMPWMNIHLRGLIAWLIWMGLHLLLILGVKNKLQVFINWIYKYFTYNQSLRLFFKDTYRKDVE